MLAHQTIVRMGLKLSEINGATLFHAIVLTLKAWLRILALLVQLSGLLNLTFSSILFLVIIMTHVLIKWGVAFLTQTFAENILTILFQQLNRLCQMQKLLLIFLLG